MADLGGPVTAMARDRGGDRACRGELDGPVDFEDKPLPFPAEVNAGDARGGHRPAPAHAAAGRRRADDRGLPAAARRGPRRAARRLAPSATDAPARAAAGAPRRHRPARVRAGARVSRLPRRPAGGAAARAGLAEPRPGAVAHGAGGLRGVERAADRGPLRPRDRRAARRGRSARARASSPRSSRFTAHEALDRLVFAASGCGCAARRGLRARVPPGADEPLLSPDGPGSPSSSTAP